MYEYTRINVMNTVIARNQLDENQTFYFINLIVYRFKIYLFLARII